MTKIIRSIFLTHLIQWNKTNFINKKFLRIRVILVILLNSSLQKDIMKVAKFKIKEMGMEHFFSTKVGNIAVIGWMINCMEKELYIILMVGLLIKASGLMTLCKDKG